jgi:hypothetical protein
MRKVLGMLLLMLPMAVFAQNGMDGTWKIDLNKAQMDTKPRVFELKNGMFSCSTCDPKINIKADGQEHKITGSPYADSEKVMVVDDHKVEVVSTKDGKLAYRATMTISADGKTMTRHYEGHPEGSAQEVSITSMLTRIGEPETGAAAISGSWKVDKLESASGNWLTFTLASTGDGVNYKASTGESYSAKFDGKDYPYHGDPGTTSVSLKKIDDHTFEETDKRNGEVVSVSKISLSQDGTALTMVSQDMHRGTSDTFVAERQEKQEAEK